MGERHLAGVRRMGTVWGWEVGGGGACARARRRVDTELVVHGVRHALVSLLVPVHAYVEVCTL